MWEELVPLNCSFAASEACGDGLEEKNSFNYWEANSAPFLMWMDDPIHFSGHTCSWRKNRIWISRIKCYVVNELEWDVLVHQYARLPFLVLSQLRSWRIIHCECYLRHLRPNKFCPLINSFCVLFQMQIQYCIVFRSTDEPCSPKLLHLSASGTFPSTCRS